MTDDRWNEGHLDEFRRGSDALRAALSRAVDGQHFEPLDPDELRLLALVRNSAEPRGMGVEQRESSRGSASVEGASRESASVEGASRESALWMRDAPEDPDATHSERPTGWLVREPRPDRDSERGGERLKNRRGGRPSSRGWVPALVAAAVLLVAVPVGLLALLRTGASATMSAGAAAGGPAGAAASARGSAAGTDGESEANPAAPGRAGPAAGPATPAARASATSAASVPVDAASTANGSSPAARGSVPSAPATAPLLPAPPPDRTWVVLPGVALQVPNSWSRHEAPGPDWCRAASSPWLAGGAPYVAAAPTGSGTGACGDLPEQLQTEHVEWRPAGAGEVASERVANGWVYTSRVVGSTRLTLVHRAGTDADVLDSVRPIG